MLESEVNQSVSSYVEPVRSAENSIRTQTSAVYADLIEVSALKLFEQERLYHIFSKYYDGHSKEQFLNDLFEKDHIILLRDKKDRTLQGFSTLLNVNIATPSGLVRVCSVNSPKI